MRKLGATVSLSVLVVGLLAPSANAAGAGVATRPHGGAWHFVNNNGTVKTARMTVGRSGLRASKITVTPAKKAGCAHATAATVSGTFRITGAGRGYRWHIGGSQAAAAPALVTIHQSGKRTTGELYVGFRTRTVAVGELVLGTTRSCDIFFGLKR
jgi:hypothetical protein